MQAVACCCRILMILFFISILRTAPFGPQEAYSVCVYVLNYFRLTDCVFQAHLPGNIMFIVQLKNESCSTSYKFTTMNEKV